MLLLSYIQEKLISNQVVGSNEGDNEEGEIDGDNEEGNNDGNSDGDNEEGETDDGDKVKTTEGEGVLGTAVILNDGERVGRKVIGTFVDENVGLGEGAGLVLVMLQGITSVDEN